MNTSRIGDIGTGICPNHETPRPYVTTFITGAPTVLVNGRVATVVGTIGEATCGHPTTALTGSLTVLMEGKPAHRVGDTGANFGPYTVTTGSENVIIN